MKKVFLAFAFTASCIIVYAQESGATFGGKAGLNFGNYHAKGDGETENGKIRTAFHIGVFANIPLIESLNFSPELVYSEEGFKEKEDGGTYTQKLGYLNVPLLIKYNTSSGFFVHTGPQIGLLLRGKSKIEGGGEELEVDSKDDFESTAFSWTLGFGYKTISGLGLDARYNLGLSNTVKDLPDGYSFKSNVIQIGLTYTLGRK